MELAQSLLDHFCALGGQYEDFIHRTFAVCVATRWTCQRTGQSGVMDDWRDVLWVHLDENPSDTCAVRSVPQTWQVLAGQGRLHSSDVGVMACLLACALLSATLRCSYACKNSCTRSLSCCRAGSGAELELHMHCRPEVAWGSTPWPLR